MLGHFSSFFFCDTQHRPGSTDQRVSGIEWVLSCADYAAIAGRASLRQARISASLLIGLVR